jgi:two-component system, OmpR family, sensor kinase
MRRITLEATRMSGLVDDMLRLARLDQHPGQEDEPVDLTAVLHGCVDRARIAGPARTWRAAIDPGLVVAGDEELLRRAGDNLLANVTAHTPAGTVATILAEESGGTITAEVSDDGPGVPAGQFPRIF